MASTSFDRVNRKTFIWSAIALLVLPPFTFFIFEKFPALLPYAKYFNWAIICMLMLLSAGRLADAGYPRWVGFAGVLVPVVAIPAIATFIAMLWFKMPFATLMTYATYLMIVGMIVLLSFLVWAACLPSSGSETDFDQDYGVRDVSHSQNRVEPKF